MKEILKNISEEFSILNRERDNILSKENLTEKDKEDLKAIQELYQELSIKLNNWASDKNQEMKIEIVEPSKSLEEQYREITQKVDDIVNKSKKKQPVFFSTDKMHKKDILKRNDFIETKTADNRDIMIHKSLIGQYYDLVKEQKNLGQQLKQNYLQQREQERTKKNKITPEESVSEAHIQQAEATVEHSNLASPDPVVNLNNVTSTQVDSIQELEKEIESILMTPGKKDRVKYKGAIYQVPTNRKGYFINKMSELDKLRSNDQVTSLSNQNTIEELDDHDSKQNGLDNQTEQRSNESIENPAHKTPIAPSFSSEKYDKIIEDILKMSKSPAPTKSVSSESRFENIIDSFIKDKKLTATEQKNTEKGVQENSNESQQENATKDKTSIKKPNFSGIIDNLIEEKDTTPLQSESGSTEKDSPEVSEESSTKNSAPQQTIEFPPLASNNKNQQSNNTPPKVKGKIVSKRKAKKNISKKMIAGISGIAVALVIIIAGGKKLYSKYFNPSSKQNISESSFEQDNNIKIFPSDNMSFETNTSEFMTESESNQTEKNLLNETVESSTERKETEPSTEEQTEKENQYVPVQSPNSPSDTTIDIGLASPVEDPLGDTFGDIIVFPEETNSNNIKMGSSVTVTGELSEDEYNAYYGTNQHLSYFGLEPERVVIGAGIVNENGMNTVYAYTPNANQIIDNLLNEGGELVSILTANKEEYLKDYDGSRVLTKEEVKASAEGWYNINDIEINQAKGVSR